jgi:hypothetical protein
MCINNKDQEEKLMAVKCNPQLTIMNLSIYDQQIFSRIAVHLGIIAKRRKLPMYLPR